jgi:hypothetical protein
VIARGVSFGSQEMCVLIEVLGVLGAILLLTSYFGQTTGRIALSSLLGPSMNLAGAVLLGVNALEHGAVPPAVLNIVWSLIALLALITQIRNRRAKMNLDNP